MPRSVNVTGLNTFLGKLWLRDSGERARQIEVASLYQCPIPEIRGSLWRLAYS
jgi:hypothetical protein